MTEKRDPIVEAVREKLLQRSQLGIKKYGTTLADNPELLIGKLIHLQEELMDACNYAEWAIQELTKLKQKGEDYDFRCG